jgi:hypothetical protein
VPHAAALLNNGTVMVAGGWDANNNTLGSTEIYDPVAGTFSPTGGLNTPRGQPAGGEARYLPFLLRQIDPSELISLAPPRTSVEARMCQRGDLSVCARNLYAASRIGVGKSCPP